MKNTIALCLLACLGFTVPVCAQPEPGAQRWDTLAGGEILVPLSAFKAMELEVTEISAASFEQYRMSEKTDCKLDSTGLPAGMGVNLDICSGEDCQAFLVDMKAGLQMNITPDYDNKELGFAVSPTCGLFLTWSSHDRDDFGHFYPHRAEIKTYTLGPGKGLGAVKPHQLLTTKGFSIEDVVWAGPGTIALKTYAGNFYSDVAPEYKYYEARLGK